MLKRGMKILSQQILPGASSKKSASQFEQAYRASDRTPFFAPGYTEAKENLLLRTFEDKELMGVFATGGQLPEGFGSRFDERVVEYPWAFSRLPSRGLILDAGSTLNKPRLLATPQLAGRQILIYTLETDWVTLDSRISYVFGDLRKSILKDQVASVIVCISTLEHVGFTYEYSEYSKLNPWPHAEPLSYLQAVKEFRRQLEPGGRLLLTVPYGKYEDHGWLQQFDASMIEQTKAAFSGAVLSETYYRYVDSGWRIASADECSYLSYFNIHETGRFEEDGLAAARAVCCIELRREEE